MRALNLQMEHALRFYIGDSSWWQGEETEASFWQDKKAFLTLNSLFYKGISNEQARAMERKFLNSVFLEDTERLLNVCENLINAMWQGDESESIQYAYRIERMSGFEDMKLAGQTISPTSTSKNGFLAEYRDKKGLVLLEFIIEPGVPCVDICKVLPSYNKREEAEILLAPWIPLEFHQRPLNSEEQMIRDYDGQPPVMACRIIAKKPVAIEYKEPKEMKRSGIDAGKRIFKALSEQKIPNQKDVNEYSLWKEAFQEQLKARCCVQLESFLQQQ